MAFSSFLKRSNHFDREFRSFAKHLLATFVPVSVLEPSVFDYVVFVGVVFSVDDDCLKVVISTVDGDVLIKPDQFFNDYVRINVKGIS